MTGMRRRVTIGFLSIVCLLFFSGMVSLVELSRLSRDTDGILRTNQRNIELAKTMLDAAHGHNVALIRLAVFGERQYDSLCMASLERLESSLQAAQHEALEKSFLDSLAFAATELRLLRTTIWRSACRNALRRNPRRQATPTRWEPGGTTTSTKRSTNGSRRLSRAT